MVPKVEIDHERGLMIEWQDGHQGSFPLGELRAACPCAGCRDERKIEGGQAGDASRSPEATRLLRVVPIGRYAICLVWGDGHNTGIYSWEYLRERCGCFACRLSRREVQG